MKKIGLETKVGLYAAAILLVIIWATVRVSDKTSVSSGGFTVKASFANATGLKLKAPVELAGVKVGVIKNIELQNSRDALVTLALGRGVKLTQNTKAILRTRGFLGETYVELIPGDPDLPQINKGEMIQDTMRTGDINSLVSQFSSIAEDVKHVTSSLKGMVGDNENYPINRVVENLEAFTEAMKDITLRNEQNIDRVASNLAEMTDQLKEVVANGRANVEESMENIASITKKIDEGKGTVGKLINDDETVEKLNDAVDNLNSTLGNFKRMEMEVGFHTEYLTSSKDFKNYVDMALSPTPDKSLLIGVVSDPDPRPSYVDQTTNVTVGGNTTTVSTSSATIDRQKIRFSAQLAKSFYDFRIRGGIIESTGGMGVDYTKGAVGVHFSAFDFSTRFNQKPHLKASGDINLTPNIYVTGGADDIIQTTGPRPDWFVGAGFRFVDEDIKSLMATSGKGLLK